MPSESALSIGILLVLGFFALIFITLVFRFIPLGLWLQAITSGVRVSFVTLFGMRFRRVEPSAIVNPLINAHKAGLHLGINELESHFLSGGNVSRVVNALISADKAGIELSYKQATAIDLAGRDVFEAVQTSVNPRVITTPKISAVETWMPARLAWMRALTMPTALTRRSRMPISSNRLTLAPLTHART